MKKNGSVAAERARRAMSQGDLIAAQVYWQDLKGLSISRALFRQGIEAAGMGDALGAAPSAEKVLYTAATRASQRVEGDVRTKTKTHYAELKDKTDAQVVYAVMARRDVGGVRAYVEEASIAIDRALEAPPAVVTLRPNIPADAARDALVDGIVDTYQELLVTVYSQEVSETLVRAMTTVCSALTLKSGLYLVTPDHLPGVRQLEAFMASDCGVALDVWEIGESTSNHRTAARNASGQLTAAYRELLAQVEAFTAKHAPAADDVPMRSVAVKMREFKELDGKVLLYADVLGDYAANLRDSIAKAKTAMLASLGLEDTDVAA